MSVDPFEFRTIMGHFATGVTVITARDGDRLHGMTANALCSLSLDPVLLLISVEKTTHMHEVITNGGVFAVNILKEGQETVSRLFAAKAEPAARIVSGPASGSVFGSSPAPSRNASRRSAPRLAGGGGGGGGTGCRA